MAGTVTVGCKLPSGLILRLFQMVEKQELVMGGGMRDVTVAHDLGVQVRINGAASERGQYKLDSNGDPIVVFRGYALTANVDADFWNEWLRQNGDSDIVRNGMIFASERTINVKAEAKEKETILSGMEPMDPGGDKRMPANRQRLKAGAIGGIETARSGVE